MNRNSSVSSGSMNRQLGARARMCSDMKLAASRNGKLVQPRKLHPTQWGVICPSETPEGASVGLVKNMALLTNITIATPSDPVREAAVELGTALFTERSSPAMFVGIHG